MRIAHLSSSYLPDTIGGTELYVRHLCQGLADLGHDVAVVWHTDAAPPQRWDGPETPVRLPPHTARRRADLYRWSNGSDPPGFQDFLRTWKPDLVHFHALTLGAGLDHARLVRAVGLPFVITYHTPGQSCLRGTLLRWGQEPCDGAIRPGRCAACSLHGQGWPKLLAWAGALSPVPCAVPDGPWLTRLARPSLLRESRRWWREFFGGAAHVIACAEFCRDVIAANGISPERVSVHRQALPGDDRQRTLRVPVRSGGRGLTLGFFGRMAPMKGPDLLIEIARRLWGDGVEVRVEMAGPITSPDEEWAAKVIAGEHVRYVGVLQGTHLNDWLDQLDLVVLPSRVLETGPLTLLEAWDRGLPVIGAAAGGLGEFLTAAGLGDLLFDVNDAAGAAAAVRRALAWTGPAPTVLVPGMAGLSQRVEAVYRRCLTSTEIPARVPVA
jgi:glycosyltransferase involved in cell wall biosynthesis